jgi:DNA-binding NarL/FixJ family response regulator
MPSMVDDAGTMTTTRSPPHPIRLLLAEDHETVREALRLLLDAQADMRVVAEAGSGRAAVERARAVRPDVVVLDLAMPDMTGLAAARALKDADPPVPIVALTRHSDEAYVQELLAAGAAAYVLKQSASSELLRAIRTAASGGRYIDPSLPPLTTPERRRRADSPVITEREAEVLRLMAVGHGNKDIAVALRIAVKTVEVHKANAMRKLALRGRTDVIRYAVLNGWLQDP